jgi:hypothetical protein
LANKIDPSSGINVLDAACGTVIKTINSDEPGE